jgi:hypothetical protein
MTGIGWKGLLLSVVTEAAAFACSEYGKWRGGTKRRNTRRSRGAIVASPGGEVRVRARGTCRFRMISHISPRFDIRCAKFAHPLPSPNVKFFASPTFTSLSNFAQQNFHYSRYTHRVAISNRRLIAADATGVTFRYKDYRIKGPG